MNRDSISASFQEWFREQYGIPPSANSVLTHVGFAEHLLQLLELMQPAAIKEAPVDG